MYSNYILERSWLEFSDLANFLPRRNMFDNDFHQSSQLEQLLIQAQGFGGLGHQPSPLPNRYVFGNDFHQSSQPEQWLIRAQDFSGFERQPAAKPNRHVFGNDFHQLSQPEQWLVRAQDFSGFERQPAAMPNRHVFGNDFHLPSHPEQRLVLAENFHVLGYQSAASAQGFIYTGPPFGIYGQGFGHRAPPFESYGHGFRHTAPLVSYGQRFNCTGNVPFESFIQGLGHNKVPFEFNPNDTRLPLGLPIVPYNLGLDPLEHLRIEGLPRLGQWIKHVITDAKHKIGRYKSDKLAAPPLVKGGVISVAPVSFRRPDQDMTPPAEKSLKRKKVEALLIARRRLSFGRIPQELEQFLPLIDEFLVRHSGIQPQVSFAQRRCGWYILIKQRSDGKFDPYYDHMPTNLRCRSMMEVIKFMLGHIISKRAQSAVPRKRRRGKNTVFQTSNDDSDVDSDNDEGSFWQTQEENLDKGKSVMVEEVSDPCHVPMGLLEYKSEGNSSREAHWPQNNVGSDSGAQQTLDLLPGPPNQTSTAEAHWAENNLGFDWRAHQTVDLLQDPSNPTPPIAFAPSPPLSPGHHGLMDFGQWIDNNIFDQLDDIEEAAFVLNSISEISI